MKVRKGDTVLVVAGKDKGAKGKVIQAIPRQDKVIVEGVNRVKKHTHASNVMVVDSDGNPTRVGYRIDDNGQKVRISRRSGKDL